MEENNIFRHNWDKFFKDGKTVILPIDHGTVIPVPELNNTGDLIEAVSPFVDGFVVNFGTARAFSDQLDGKGICFRTDVYKPSYQDNPDHGSYRAFTADDALSVGAHAVMNMCYTHHQSEDRIYRECASLVSECIDSELPVILESLPFGIGKPDDYNVENISFAVRMAAELGADVIKTAFPHDAEINDFKKIIDSSFVPVVVLGGAAMSDDEALLKMVKMAMDSGASGIAVGRNVFQHENPALVAKSLHAIVHEDANLDQALKIINH